MKKLLLSTAAIAAMGMFAGYAQADSSASATANASATVVEPITIEEDAALYFGSFAIDGAGTVSTADGFSANLIPVPGDEEPAAASFLVTGEAGEEYTVALTGPFTVTDGTDTMTYVPAAPADAQAVDDGGFNVNAVLTVLGTEGPGEYVGTYNVAVVYE